MWQLGDFGVSSRLLIGSSLYPSIDIMQQAIRASSAQVVTVSLRRQQAGQGSGEAFWDALKALDLKVLPNTAGCHSAQEAITTAQMARELFGTHWIKLEVIGDDHSLQPDPFALLEAARELIAEGFEVFPYCTDDLILCDKLVEVGCRILMPWAAPIGTAKGLINPYALRALRHRFSEQTLIIDAGLGAPSHAAKAMELGYDGVLLNTAIAKANDPTQMARAFALAVEAGHLAHRAGLIPEQDLAQPSTPDIGKPFWHHG